MVDKMALRKDSAHTATSSVPDVCLTPMGSAKVPVPYISTGFFGDAVRTAKKVRMNGKEAFTTHSRIKKTFGTEPGVDKGVTSSGHLGPAKIPKGSESMNIEGHQSTKADDTTELNMKDLG